MELDEKQKKKVDKLSLHLEDKDVALFNEVNEINEHLEGIHENLGKLAEKPDKEVPGLLKVEIPGAELITIKGEKGDTGEKGEQGDKGDTGPQGKQGIQGAKGLKGDKGDKGEKGDDGIDGKDGKDGVAGKDGSPDTGEQIISKINESEGEINPERVKGLNDSIKKLENRPTGSRGLFGGRSDNWHTGDSKATHTLSVQTSAPSNPQIGDIWIDVS